jgi:hypothetical protein
VLSGPVIKSQSKEGKITGFDFYRDPLNAERPFQPFAEIFEKESANRSKVMEAQRPRRLDGSALAGSRPGELRPRQPPRLVPAMPQRHGCAAAGSRTAPQAQPCRRATDAGGAQLMPRCLHSATFSLLVLDARDSLGVVVMTLIWPDGPCAGWGKTKAEAFKQMGNAHKKRWAQGSEKT